MRNMTLTITFLMSLCLVPVGGAMAYEFTEADRQAEWQATTQQTERNRSSDFQRQLNQATTDQQRTTIQDNANLRQNREQLQEWQSNPSGKFNPRDYTAPGSRGFQPNYGPR